jgi:hypothetical protein
MLDRHGQRGTFYIARRYRANRLSEAAIRRLAARHEIGAHTLSHPDLTRLSPRAREREITGSRDWLQDVTGKPVAMFCYPLGQFDGETRRLVAEAGFRGARTVRQFSVAPHRDRFAMRTTLQVHPTLLRSSTIGDFTLYWLKQKRCAGERASSRGRSMLRRWSSLADFVLTTAARDTAAVFHLWGHSWEIEEQGMWADCDALLRRVGELGCQPRTNGEICQAG